MIGQDDRQTERLRNAIHTAIWRNLPLAISSTHPDRIREATEAVLKELLTPRMLDTLDDVIQRKRASWRRAW